VANTTWSTTDKSSNLTLSGSNLTATAGSGGFAWVRTTDKQVAGKFYWEIAATTFVNASSQIGVATATANISVGLTAAGTLGVARAGNISLDGNNTGVSIGSIAGGTVCFAFDVAARLIWVRLGSAGNWNNSSTANPATSAGGISTPGLGLGIPIYAAAFPVGVSDAVTANFGDSAFTGTVPSGFTSGFTAGVTTSTNALVTQTAVEHWITTNTPAQVTQVALEHWASVAAALPSTGNDIRAMVLA
jgi:hypothetical protein